MAAQAKHREAIVRTAATLFRRQGYAATGTNEIVSASGAPKGSLYHYFPGGKADIAEAALRHAGAKVQATLEHLAATEASPGAMVRAYAALLAGWMAKSGFRDGCPITTTLLELAPGNTAIAEVGRGVLAGWHEVYATRLGAAGVEPARAMRLARTAVGAIRGALILARTERSAAAILETGAEMATLLDAATR